MGEQETEGFRPAPGCMGEQETEGFRPAPGCKVAVRSSLVKGYKKNCRRRPAAGPVFVDQFG